MYFKIKFVFDQNCLMVMFAEAQLENENVKGKKPCPHFIGPIILLDLLDSKHGRW